VRGWGILGSLYSGYCIERPLKATKLATRRIRPWLVACVVLYVLDHLAIGRLSHLKEPGTPLWGEPGWGKGKEERGTRELCSFRK
jgi:hypothetical protein